MEKREYQKLVKDITPKPKKMCHTIYAFLSGGLLGALCEILRALLINYYNLKNSDAVSIILFLLIIGACFLTAFYDFDKL